MDLQTYLEARGESYRQFADRVGVSPQTIANVAQMAVNCRVDVAQRIIRASKEAPAPGRRGSVTLGDLVVG